MLQLLELPAYVLTLVGLWKLLGIAALLAGRRVGRLVEWAYAGFFFDLTGAGWCHAAAGGSAGVPPSQVFLVLQVASYALRERAVQQAGQAGVAVGEDVEVDTRMRDGIAYY